MTLLYGNTTTNYLPFILVGLISYQIYQLTKFLKTRAETKEKTNINIYISGISNYLIALSGLCSMMERIIYW